MMRFKFPVIVDGAALVALIFWLPKLGKAWQTLSGWHVLWLAILFIWFCLSVYIIRKLVTTASVNKTPRFFNPGKKTRFVLAILFGIGLMLAISHQLGYLETALTVDPRALGAGESAAFFVFAPGAWLGLALLYLIFLGFDIRETFQPASAGSNLILLFGLVGINSMLLGAAVELRVVINQMGGDGRVLSGLGVLIVLILLFVPPRLIFLSKRPDAWAAITYAILIIVCAWHTTLPI